MSKRRHRGIVKDVGECTHRHATGQFPISRIGLSDATGNHFRRNTRRSGRLKWKSAMMFF
jgi:hypothetical protein